MWRWRCSRMRPWMREWVEEAVCNDLHSPSAYKSARRRQETERPTTDLTSQWAGEHGAGWQLPSSLSLPPFYAPSSLSQPPWWWWWQWRSGGGSSRPAGVPLEGQVGRAASTNCQRPGRVAEEPGALHSAQHDAVTGNTHTHTADC